MPLHILRFSPFDPRLGFGYFWEEGVLILFYFLITFHSQNYNPNYILCFKLFQCTSYVLSYKFFYTLYPDIKFTINLDEKI